ncbi:hypothetical protein L3Q82_019221, partial [Scortum barcoo]
MEEIVDCTTDYINFCMDTVVPVRSVRCFANNKPWITSDIKGLLNQKKKAFKDGDTQELKQIQKELRVQLREAKEQYRRKIEQRMQNNNMREVWEGMKTITGCSSKRGAPIEGDVGRANQLNQFFNGFDHQQHGVTRTTCSSTPLRPGRWERDPSSVALPQDLRINMEDFKGNQRYAEYKNFKVGDEKVKKRLCQKEIKSYVKDQYQLHLGEDTRNAGNVLADINSFPSAWQKWASPGLGSNTVKFSTYEQLNNGDTENNDTRCIRRSKSGWWFS